jgi:hypothetical protein
VQEICRAPGAPVGRKPECEPQHCRPSKPHRESAPAVCRERRHLCA